MSSSSSSIGFVGLGIMGEGMASRLVSEGIAGSKEQPLVVWNRSVEKCQSLKTKFPSAHIQIMESPRQVVNACGITYSMLSTPEVSKLVFEGPNGVLAGVSSTTSIVDCATLSQEDMQNMSKAVVEKGGRFLEAPVSGSKVPAANGSLIFLCAGNEELYNEIKDSSLDAMGKASHYFGTTVGGGTRAKLVINSLMGTMVAALSEGLALSEKVGLDADTILEVISQSAIASPVYALKGPKMLAGEYEANFPLKHAHKDMKLACDMAHNANVEYSVMKQAERLFEEATQNNNNSKQNLAEQDFSAVLEQVKEKSQTKA